MRGTDSQVYCDNTNRLRLGLLVHILDLCKWAPFLLTYFCVGECCMCLLFRWLYLQETVSGREDYGFHCYMEFCQFVYCLLSRTRQLSDLPELHDWEAYMDTSRIEAFKKIDTADVLFSNEIGAELQRGKTGEMQEFRNSCRELMDRLEDVLVDSNLVSSDFLQGVYAFCPELLLDGDDRYIFRLFSKLVRVLERSGALSCEEAKSGSEEFVTFVVDARRQHVDSARSAEAIADVMDYFLSDYSFLARKNLCRLLKTCCLIMRRPAADYPEMVFSLDNCVVPAAVISSCLRGVQSYVRNPEFKLGLSSLSIRWNVFVMLFLGLVNSYQLLPILTLGVVCVGDGVEFVQRYSELFKAHIDRRKEESYQRFRTANQCTYYCC